MEGASSAEDSPPQKVPTCAAEQMSVGQSAAPGSLEAAAGGGVGAQCQSSGNSPQVFRHRDFRRGS